MPILEISFYFMEFIIGMNMNYGSEIFEVPMSYINFCMEENGLSRTMFFMSML